MFVVGAMVAVLATWLLLGLMFFGIGRLTCALLRFTHVGWQESSTTFLIGWGVTIAFLQLWHLWQPVDARCLALAGAVGVGGLLFDHRSLRAQCFAWLAQRRQRPIAWLDLAKILLVIAWANLASGPVSRFDSGLYHLQAVRWNATYPIVPGLGNLHGRLAFNNSSFLYTAMLDVGPWQQKSQHLANGLLAIVVMLELVSAFPRVRKADGGIDLCSSFRALLFPVAAYFTCKEVSSPQPDAVTFLLGIVITSWLFELLHDRSLATNKKRLLIVAICFLSSVGLSVKLNFLPLGFLSSVLALGIAWGMRSQVALGEFSRWRTALLCGVSAAVLLVPWLARGILLSGYPLYPSTAFACDVPWRIPLEEVKDMQVAVIGFARHQGSGYAETIGNWRWVGPWLLRELGHVVEVSLPLACFLAAVGIALAGRIREGRRADARWTPYLCLLPSVATIAFVLITAPIYRFAGAAIWIVAIGALLLVLDDLRSSSVLYLHWRRCVLGVGILLWGVGLVKSVHQLNGPSRSDLFPPIPRAELTIQTTDDGLRVFVPGSDYRAWDAPLPSTPYLHPRLALRRQDDLGSGFVIRADARIAREPASPRAR